MPHSSLISHDFGLTEEKIAERLKIEPSADTFTVHKLFSADDDPAVYMINVIPLDLEEHAENTQLIKEADPAIQIYQLLADCFGQSVAYQISGIEAVPASDLVSSHLGCQVGAPVLCIEEVGYNHEDQPIMYVCGYYLPGMIHFSQVRKPV